MAGVGRIVRTRIGPWVVFLGTVAAVVYLWTDVEDSGQVIGFAHGVEHKVASLQPGRIQHVAVELGQDVTAGQIIAEIDATELDADIRIQQAERARIEAAIRAKEGDAKARVAETSRRLERAVEQAEATLAQARARRKVKAAEFKALGRHRKELKELIDKRLVQRREAGDIDVEHATARQEVNASADSISILEAHVAAARTRLATLPQDLVERAIGPLKAELAVVDNKIQSLQARREALVLRAPASGQVASVLMRRGEVARSGDPLVTIVSSSSNRVVACVSEQQALSVQVGASARLSRRDRVGDSLSGRVVSLGPLVDEVPLRCRRDPRLPAWGRDVVILLDQPTQLVPGMAFNVSIDKQERPSGSAMAAAPPKQIGAPTPMLVPPPLAAASRFEPSGLVWVPRLARYVLVSDDTGHRDRDEHIPWLFTMDADGKLAERPLPVFGVKEFNDLEAIAAAPGSGLYLLASQSHSKKGKRKPSRELFGRAEPTGQGYQLTASVRLAKRLDTAGSKALRELGLENTRDLDIEGMTASGSGLLLGLKAPLTADSEAILWRLERPEQLLSGGDHEAAGLKLWATVKLEVEADGRVVPGGIAELLSLPDGSLLIAATASGTNPARQSGSLWHVARPTAGRLQARRVQVFEGLKPEGLALSPRSGKLAVAFDTGADVPLWAELPWPRG